MTWRSFVADVGSLERALWIVGYAAVLASLILALIAQAAWSVAKRIRPRREVEREARDRRRELEAACNLTEGRWR